MKTVPSSEAARRLGVVPATVINMIEDGRLSGERGPQPKRPRWLVHVNADGRLIDRAGVPVAEPLSVVSASPMLAELIERLEALERRPGDGAGSVRYREAALLLSGTIERQQEALALQTRAFEVLNEIVAEQGKIIAGLLVPDDVPTPTGSDLS